MENDDRIVQDVSKPALRDGVFAERWRICGLVADGHRRGIDLGQRGKHVARRMNNIFQQAATAMLAQANQAPQTVLQLLR
jgi:hypothetical protein